MNHNIGKTLPDIAARLPDQTGLICKAGNGYKSWTFKEMDTTADWFAHKLCSLGVHKGDRVMLMVKPSIEFITLTFALFKMGAVVILIDPGMGYKNLLKCIGQVKPAIFIGIPKAHIFKRIFPKPFKTVRTSVCIGHSFGLFGTSLRTVMANRNESENTPFPAAEMAADQMAAILFTTGSTGPPKGVRYTHGVFQAQLQLIRDYYHIGPQDTDQPAFPLFVLFSTALGACSVIPEMNPAKPAQVDPARFIKTIIDHQVTYSFGSPAIWNVVSRYCQTNKIKLPSLKKILMAGAPVPGELLERTLEILEPGADIHTPYGATESLPIASIAASEILSETWDRTKVGKGVCVGKSLPQIEIRIIGISDEPITAWHADLQLPVCEIGEIIVKGPVVTSGYDNNDSENQLSKISDEDGFWHRMGDVGYFDVNGRLWFCGRKGHRVITESGTMYTICCEALFNEHPAVFRSALVGVGTDKNKTPVILVEMHNINVDQQTLFAELENIAGENELTKTIKYFLIHPGFPVDIRHNAKIFREKLALFAEQELRSTLNKQVDS